MLGPVVDGQTRCVHYRTRLDVVAIRFHCCREYYPCHRCHDEASDGHPAVLWPFGDRAEHAVLCGVCGTELAIGAYLAADGCPHCSAAFNPRCKLHAGLYFEPGPG